ncbi:MAG: NTP transferase domain-containing protein [Kiritimatiellae bacterium]|nr:NTP transferase domain-containing protein [Kiritimatiellia bacterium]
MMQAVILAGGRGTRLSALYADRPKALVPLAGRPFLEWQLEWLTRGGITRVHIAAGYMADRLLDWLREHGEELQSGVQCSVFSVQELFTIHHSPCTISLSREPAPLGTGGGLKYVEPWIATDPCLVLNGDSLLPRLDFQSLEKAWHAVSRDWKSPPAMLAVTRIEEAGRYGTVEFDEARRVTAFREKARRESGWVNGGVYVVPRRVLDSLEPGRTLSLETDVFPSLAEQGLLAAFAAPAPLLDMGTPEGLAVLESFLATGAPFSI